MGRVARVLGALRVIVLDRDRAVVAVDEPPEAAVAPARAEEAARHVRARPAERVRERRETRRVDLVEPHERGALERAAHEAARHHAPAEVGGLHELHALEEHVRVLLEPVRVERVVDLEIAFERAGVAPEGLFLGHAHHELRVLHHRLLVGLHDRGEAGRRHVAEHLRREERAAAVGVGAGVARHVALPVADASLGVGLDRARALRLGEPARGETAAPLKGVRDRLRVERLRHDVAVHEPERAVAEEVPERVQHAARAEDLRLLRHRHLRAALARADVLPHLRRLPVRVHGDLLHAPGLEHGQDALEHRHAPHGQQRLRPHERERPQTRAETRRQHDGLLDFSGFHIFLVTFSRRRLYHNFTFHASSAAKYLHGQKSFVLVGLISRGAVW